MTVLMPCLAELLHVEKQFICKAVEKQLVLIFFF
jgi:hypothetical protein